MAKKQTRIARTAGAAKKGFQAPSRRELKKNSDPIPENDFPVVGVGASAGGLEAFSEMLKVLPVNIGMAFVYVQHLDATQVSMLPELLQRVTKLKVELAKNKVQVEKNHVYVIPPNRNIEMLDGMLIVKKRKDHEGRMDVIDNFFRSLAESKQANAIGVILSGNAYDGTRGLLVIKGEGGVTFVQSESSAKFTGMPHSAISSGAADFIRDPRGIAMELVALSKRTAIEGNPNMPSRLFSDEDTKILHRIYHVLYAAHGLDFHQYKPTTLFRRIEKRMLLYKFSKLLEYFEFLEKNPKEIEALFQDMLISVTDFFRDADTFTYLQKRVFPKLIKGRKSSDPIRIWSVGCSTGEETYSIAMALLEFLESERLRIPVQIFASDANPSSINTARQGIYPLSIAAHISNQRLRRFFTRIDDRYQILEMVRDMCVFAVHDVTRDPPFSNMDLVSCRNVLIYFNSQTQRKVVPTFHYALRPNGFMLLGRSESVNEFGALFATLDKKHRVYQKKPGTERARLPVISAITTFDIAPPKESRNTIAAKNNSLDNALQQKVERLLLSQYTPPAVVVTANMEIVQFRGSLDAYLQFPSGNATLSLLKMAREDILLDLRTALNEAKKTNRTVRKAGVRIVHGGQERYVDIEVMPLDAVKSTPTHYFVIFHQVAHIAPPTSGGLLTSEGWEYPKGKEAKRAAKMHQRLQQELLKTREQLKIVLEDQEATAEEFQTANEEILSSNEELQSINEELETAKEELQSTNEELTTVNEELQARNALLGHLNNDLQNFLMNADVAMVMLGRDMKIRRITPGAERLLSLIPSDVGRPITDLKLGLDIPNLEEVIHETISTMSASEFEIQDRRARWYSMRVRPYKTEDNKIEGAVLTLVDIDALKKSLSDLESTAQELKDKQVHLAVAKTKADHEVVRREELEQQKDEFIAILSHELRNPLAPIRANAELLREYAKSHDQNPVIGEAAEVIERQSKNLARILDDLLDVSRVLLGNAKMQTIKLEKERIDVNTLMKRAIESATPFLNSRRMQVHASLFSTPLIIEADPVRIEQVLVNILNNAGKYSNPQSRVWVRVNKEGNKAVVVIKDEGTGIGHDFLPKVFDLFSQGSLMARDKFPGLGVGLALARSLVALHGGDITAHSEGKDKGSEFVIKLPLV